MTLQNRREAIHTLATLGAGVLLGGPVTAMAAEGSSEPTLAKSAFSDALKPKPLPFTPSKLRGISEKLTLSHWENNYGGAVKALNATKKRLSEVASDKVLPPYLYAEMKREHLMRTGSVVLHELYFGNLGGDGKAAGELGTAIKAAFGSHDKWETEFRTIGAGLGGGSGWVILGYNLQLQTLENYWSSDHMHNSPATLPILVMDMYEHAYQMDYGAAAAKYVDAFMQNINWQAADERLALARKLKWS
jgi:superoxide dismutase, Fe-Mn family